jgi:hypothetical protein
MNELLAQIYNTAGTSGEETLEKTAEATMLDELEKIASEEGIDLSELSDDDIVEILAEAMNANAGVETEKTASVETPIEETEDEGQVKLAEADFLGRAMAHAFYNELSQIGSEIEKQASEEDPFEGAAMERAEAILAAASEALENQDQPTNVEEKTASARLRALMVKAAEGEEAEEGGEVAQEQAGEGVDDALTARALEILDANDYDVEAIAQLLG